MYRDASTGPCALERDPRSLVEEVGLVEPGEEIEVARVDRTPTTIAKVRIAYDAPAPEAEEILVDAPAPIAGKLARAQHVPERELPSGALDDLPQTLLRSVRETVRSWSRTATATSVRVREEDVLRIDYRDASRRRHRAWLGTAPVRLLEDEVLPRLRDDVVDTLRTARSVALAGLVAALVYALAAAMFILPWVRW